MDEDPTREQVPAELESREAAAQADAHFRARPDDGDVTRVAFVTEHLQFFGGRTP